MSSSADSDQSHEYNLSPVTDFSLLLDWCWSEIRVRAGIVRIQHFDGKIEMMNCNVIRSHQDELDLCLEEFSRQTMLSVSFSEAKCLESLLKLVWLFAGDSCCPGHHFRVGFSTSV